MKKFNEDKIIKGARLILEGIGENPDEKRLQGTPKRIASMLVEVLDGRVHKMDVSEILKEFSAIELAS